MMLRVTETIMWVRVERESFDLAGILISSFQIAGICIGVSLFFGGLWGAYLILRRRRESAWQPAGHLGLETRTAG